MRDRRLWFDLDGVSAPATSGEGSGISRVTIVGLPFDGSASRGRGAALAPARLRAISKTSDAVTRRGRLVEAVAVADMGDIEPAGRDGRALPQRTYLDRVAARLDALPKEAFVLALGGDNSVSIPCLESFARRHGAGAGVIWFDAHPDLFEIYDGNPDSHACALRRGLSRGGLSSDRVVLVGTRSWSLEELRYIGEEGIEVITAAELRAAGPEEAAGRIAVRLDGAPAVYFAVDIDGFDASAAPGTGYPMPGGVTPAAFFELQELIFQRLPVRAMDLTEISPPADLNDMTSFLGAQVILEALAALA